MVYGCFQKWWYPRIIHFNRVFHYKPSILGYPYFWKHPYIPVASASASPGCQVVLHKATAIDAKAITSTQGTQNCVPPNAVSHILRELELAYSPLDCLKKTSKEKCLVAHTNSTVVSTSYCYQCASCCFEEVCSDADSAHWSSNGTQSCHKNENCMIIDTTIHAKLQSPWLRLLKSFRSPAPGSW